MSRRSLVLNNPGYIAPLSRGTWKPTRFSWSSNLRRRWSTAVSGQSTPSGEQVTRLLAVVYADIAGYSRLFALDDIGTVARLRSLHQDRIRPAIVRFQAQFVQITGDSILLLFETVGQAVECAVSIQSQLLIDEYPWPDDRRMRLRIGVDVGDVIMDGVNFHSDGVIVASRLQAVCPPGAICVTRTVHERGAERLGLPVEAIGPLALKGVAHPVEAFVLWPPS